MRQAIPNRVDPPLRKEVLALYASRAIIWQGQKAVMPGHTGIATSNFLNQTNRSIGTETTPKKQEAVHTVQKSEFFTDRTPGGICSVILSGKEHSTGWPPTIAVQLQ
jgi:hypothetical protein